MCCSGGGRGCSKLVAGLGVGYVGGRKIIRVIKARDSAEKLLEHNLGRVKVKIRGGVE
jgi:hypothetical protein